MLLVNNHERTVTEIIVDAWLTATVGPTTLRLLRLDPLPPVSTPPIQDDMDLLFREISLQMMPKVRLVSRYDEQASNLVPGGL